MISVLDAMNFVTLHKLIEYKLIVLFVIVGDTVFNPFPVTSSKNSIRQTSFAKLLKWLNRFVYNFGLNIPAAIYNNIM